MLRGRGHPAKAPAGEGEPDIERRSTSGLRDALGHVWVRAIVAPSVYLTFLFGLFGLARAELKHGDPGLGQSMVIFLAVSVFAAIFIGPAWVIQPRTPPRGGPPRGGVLPLPLPSPEQPVTTGDEMAAA